MQAVSILFAARRKINDFSELLHLCLWGTYTEFNGDCVLSPFLLIQRETNAVTYFVYSEPGQNNYLKQKVTSIRARLRKIK